MSAEKIKILRERTGVSMSKCKEALDKAGGDIELAIEDLRKTGIASAVKKEGRETKEGIITTYATPRHIVLFELSAETDFVVSNEQFQTFAKQLAHQIAAEQPKDLAQLLASPYMAEPNFTVEEKRALIIQAIGENIQPKRFTIVPHPAHTTIGIYSHMNGKIVTLVVLEGASDEQSLANDLAMHVCASSPEYLDPSQIPQEVLDKEREIARSQMQGKPAHMLESIVEGKLRAYYKESCFLKQAYFKEPKLTIEEVILARSRLIGKALKLVHYLRWSVK